MSARDFMSNQISVSQYAQLSRVGVFQMRTALELNHADGIKSLTSPIMRKPTQVGEEERRSALI